MARLRDPRGPEAASAVLRPALQAVHDQLVANLGGSLGRGEGWRKDPCVVVVGVRMRDVLGWWGRPAWPPACCAFEVLLPPPPSSLLFAPARPDCVAESTIELEHNNSMLVLGPRGSGKSLVSPSAVCCCPGEGEIPLRRVGTLSLSQRKLAPGPLRIAHHEPASPLAPRACSCRTHPAPST